VGRVGQHHALGALLGIRKLVQELGLSKGSSSSTREQIFAHIMQEIVYAVEGDPCLYEHRDHPKDCVKLVAEKIEH
jgi:hypothetical protein